MRIYLLDVGSKMYGDCILVVDGNSRLLIDGAHPGDDRPGGGAAPIQDQLSAILNEPPPFDLDLLVVTHCHSDHIGCLPELFSAGLIRPKRALVADEKLGFGRAQHEDATQLSDDPMIAKVVAGLREEPHANARTDADLAQFLEDAAYLETRYGLLLRGLAESGVEIARYGRDDHETLIRKVPIAGLEVLGPTQDQLLVCAEAIARTTRDALDRAEAARALDAELDAVQLYRLLAGGNPAATDVATDAPGKGAALNDQSLLVMVGDGDSKCLLAGDMQFSAPETPEVAPFMEALRARIGEAAPFAFVKVPHHGSYNGLSAALLTEWKTTALGITTGRGDPGHPSRSVLDLLARNRAKVQWARTDRNGLVTVTIEGGKVRMTPTRGALNDSSVNGADAISPAGAAAAPAPVVLAGGDTVEIIARIPNRPTKVTITVEIDGGGASGSVATVANQRRSDAQAEGSATDFRLAPGRQLEPLLFATDLKRLGDRIGADAASALATAIKEAGQQFVDVAGSVDPRGAVRAAAQGKAGIVLIGGYDVLPSYRFDVLPADLRTRLGSGVQDTDDFIVWSDQPYADVSEDGMADVPISRVPDGGSADLVRIALAAPGTVGGGSRFGLRNMRRPFADPVFSSIAGAEAMKLCKPTLPTDYPAAAADARAVYIMMHGSDADATAFWGEEDDGSMLEGFALANVPASSGAVVFSGCCWGALTVAERANRAGKHVTPRSAGDSIALAFLAGGASAFVGCTGTHYSPSSNTPDFFGGPMHTAFWSQIAAGVPPAKALFQAKVDYIAGMPHGRSRPGELAIEYKILRQFTCLGLGW